MSIEQTNAPVRFSIVVPFHNEEENVTELYDRLKDVMEATGETFELVFVDDGSRDKTFIHLQEIAAVDSRVVVVKLRRNFGPKLVSGRRTRHDHTGSRRYDESRDLRHQSVAHT